MRHGIDKTREENSVYEVIIVGGGTAGLSAALVLGRARRRVLLLDTGQPRNAPAQAAHGFFSRDGTPPLELLEIGRRQLCPYDSVEIRAIEATGARHRDDGFAVDLVDGTLVRTRMLILATGVRDELPDLPGFNALWGRGIYHCPYCHGWEVRDQPLAVRANGELAIHLAPLIRQWSRDLVLLTDGPISIPEADLASIRSLDIQIREDPIARLEGDAGLVRIAFTTGEPLARRALFYPPTQHPRTDLARQLGCDLIEEGPIPGLIRVDGFQQTTVPGVYAAGDVATMMQQLATAAASGATAAAGLNLALVRAEMNAPPTR
jgi:thioredoxin reductase